LALLNPVGKQRPSFLHGFGRQGVIIWQFAPVVLGGHRHEY